MSAAKTNKIRCDIWTNNYIARSVRFSVCMFLGRGSYDKRWTTSIKEARKIRNKMQKEYANDPYKRPVMIYAYTPDNLSIHVE